MKNFKVRTKFMVVFGVILCYLIMVIFSVYSTVAALQGGYTNFYEQIFAKAHPMSEMLSNTYKLSTYSAYALQTDASTESGLEYLNNNIASIDEAFNHFKNGLTTWESKFSSDENITKIKGYSASLETAVPNFETALRSGVPGQAQEVYFTQVMPIIDELIVVLEELDTTLNAESVNQYETDRVNLIANTRFTLVVLLFAIGVVMICAPYLIFLFEKPIRLIHDNVERMGKGDFSGSVGYTSKDELGQLATTLDEVSKRTYNIIEDLRLNIEHMANGNYVIETNADYIGQFKEIKDSFDVISASMSQTVGAMSTAASEVNRGASHVSDASQNLAQGSTEQASAVEELNGTVNDIYNKSLENTDNANTVASGVKKAGQAISDSNMKMKTLVDAMEDMTNKSNEISKIVKTIEDIAFQTNILALNAAVEAARAGTAGKGFAVVADEVRNLATKSSDAASETTKLIGETIEAINNGSKIANDTADDLENVTKQTSAMAENVAHIAEASDAQGVAIAQVKQGIEQISVVVNTNSATSEETAAASEELSAQAIKLDELIGKFKVVD